MPDNESMLEKEKTMDIVTENKLVTTKPWFSKSDLLKPENESLEKNPKSMSSMSSDIRPHKKSPILSSSNIYDTTQYKNANTTLQRSLSTSNSFVADLCTQELLKIKS